MVRRGTLLRTTLAAFLVAAILLALHWLGWLRPIESGLGIVAEPVVRGFRIVVQRVGTSLRLLGRIAELDQENKRLTLELEQTRTELGRLHENDTELQELRERLDAPQPEEFELRIAAVIGHDAVSGTKTLTINRGSSDGLKDGMAVISSGGVLIGRVQNTLAGQAEILLLADDRSAVPSRLAESRTTGITRGELGLGLKMTDIPQQDTVNVGDQVVTSGLGGDIPKGIAIGSVEAVETAANALFQVARVRPFIDVTRLEYVNVIISF
jgi:rod shape-determining protein MreC